MDVADWLRGLGLQQYALAFRDNDIDSAVLPSLTADDLKDLGVTSVGHRRRLLGAIAALNESNKPGVVARALDGIPTEAERRQLTVMFCDLVGSTALSARLDPEELHDIIARYHAWAAQTVARHGGYIAKYMGDGVLVYFGYPQAHEYDAEEAVRTGLALVDAVGEIRGPQRLQIRVGIASGLVVIGDLMGEGEARERAIVGEAPNLAARLQALAEPGTVLIAESTRRLTGGLFDYEDLGAVEIKGFGAPVIAAGVLRESEVEGRFAALRTPGTPLIGRDEELALLQRRWQQAKDGEGRVVLVSGEPGIGKSRLAQALLEQLAGEPHTRLRFFCSPHHQDTALYPTIAHLERAAALRREDSPAQRLQKLEAVLRQATSDLGEVVPLIAALLSIPAERCPPLGLTPQKQKEKTLLALVAQVEGLAARQPVLLLFEDAQWSDPTSLELLDLIIDRVAQLRMLVIITFRPEFARPWAGRPDVSLLSLNRLTPGQRGDMVAGLTSGKALPREITDQIVDRTDGVPLFIEELTKAVIESGLVTDADDHYRAVDPLPELAIPSSLQASLLARLDRLAPAREVAQIGAALGRQFSHELISAVASMPQRQLDDAIAQLVNAELIYRRGTPPDAEYRFKHALVQDAAYSTLLRSRRQHLHARIAATLEDRFPEVGAAQPALLAHHCTEACLIEKAVDYWLAAGRQAWARSAAAEAVALLHRGLALLHALPDCDWRRETELDLQTALGRALIINRGSGAPELDEVHSRARELASRLNRPRALLFALWGQFTDHMSRADLQQARRLAAELRDLGEAAGDVPMQVMGCDASGFTCFELGEFTEGRTYLEKGLDLYDPADRSSYSELLSYDARVWVRLHLACLLACLGHIDHALRQRGAALDEARRLSHPPTLAYALGFFAWNTGSFLSFKPASLLQSADELLALATEHGLRWYQAFALMERGWCLAALGRADEGISLFTTGAAGWDKLRFIVHKPWVLTLLGDAFRIAGQPQAALEHIEEARRVADATEERWLLAETVRLRGDVLVSIDDRTGAETSYREAIAIAQQQGAKLWELRAATSLARLWHHQAKRKQAHALLAPVYNWLTEGLGTPVLQEAKALLDELA